MNLTDEQLTRLACGEVHGAELEHLLASINADPALLARYHAIRRSVDALTEARSLAESFSVSQQALDRLHEHVPAPAPSALSNLVSGIDRAVEKVATLVFDSFRTMATPALRGGGRARLVEFQTDDTQIDLHIDHDDTRGMTVIAGEIRAEHPTQIVTAQEIRSGRSFEAQVTPDGFFDIEVPSGTYRLTIGQPNGEQIVVDCVGL